MKRPALVLLLGLALPLVPDQARAQGRDHALGAGGHYHVYSFDDGLGATSASLLLIPVAYQLPIGDRFTADLYAAWARGAVEEGGRTFELSGPTDTQVRTRFQVSDWAILTASFSVPTGEEGHSPDESVVASTLATDLLGFREANWGTGFGFTTGVATARQIGEWGLGVGASYRLSEGFEPQADTSLTYEPGNETRVRVGLDRNFGEGGTFTAGFTFQNFDTDKLGGSNLFDAGNRFRADASLAFRTGGSTWTVFGSDTSREQGDQFVAVLNDAGDPVRDTTLQVAGQNIAHVGIAGSIPVGATYRFRPVVDFQLQSQDVPGGDGWIVGVGGDFPLRLFGPVDVFPRARFLVGALDGPDVSGVRVWGGEFGGTIRIGR